MKENRSGRNRRNKNASKAKVKSISNIRCPEGVSLKDWQLALRVQAAESERLIVTPPETSEYFTVRNPRTDHTYNVFYKGTRSKWNYCSCLDFRTSQLGSCKHIEAVSLANGGEYAKKKYVMPDYTSVYVDYRGPRSIKIRVAPTKKAEMQPLVKLYFSESGELKPEGISTFESFISQAKEIDPRFVVYDDALDLIIEERDRFFREKLLANTTDDQVASLLKNSRLYPYQVEGVRFAMGAGRSIIADEMGLGKTIQALATAELMRQKGLVNSVVIVCPTSLKYQWLNEIKRFTDADVIAVEGNILVRKEQLESSSFYKVCSYQSLANDVKAGNMPYVDLIIFDEIQRLKNWDTKISRTLRQLKSRYVIALTGTPLENKLTELYSVMNFVDPFVLGPYYKFVNETTLFDEAGKIVGYKNLDHVSSLLSGHLLRRKKSEVALQMPDRSDMVRFVPMTKEQAEIHEELKAAVAKLVYRWRRMHFLNEADRRALMLSLSKMRMVCDSTFVLDQKTRFDTKVAETLYIVNEVIENGDTKLVIFSQWERMLRLIAQELEENDIKFCFLHGSVPSRKRKALIDAFQSDPEVRVFLSTDTGSTGLNLQAGSIVVNIDLPWNPAVLEQRIARCYRLGQKNNIQVINLVASGTIEERMLTTLDFKAALFEGVFDEGDSTVLLDKNRFDKIIDVVAENVVDEKEGSVIGTTDLAEMEETRGEDKPSSGSQNSNSGEKEDEKEEPRRQPTTTDRKETAVAVDPVDGEQLVAQGITFLSNLAEALKTPESTQKLVDTMVKTDSKTGKSTMTIPIPDKKNLTVLLRALGTLLNS